MCGAPFDLEALLTSYDSSHQNWPEDVKARRKHYFKRSMEHHPDKPGGNRIRFEMLNFAYRRANHRSAVFLQCYTHTHTRAYTLRPPGMTPTTRSLWMTWSESRDRNASVCL